VESPKTEARQSRFNKMTFARKLSGINAVLCGRGKSLQNCLGLKIRALKANEKKVGKKLSLLAGIFFLVNDIALLKGTKNSRKKPKSFGGKIVLRKKSLRF